MSLPLSRRRFFKASSLSLLGFGLSWVSQSCAKRPPSLGEPAASTQAPVAPAVEQATATPTPQYASGGTAAMATDYPNPFERDRQPNCTLTCAQTQGPCYVPAIPDRHDISEGEIGLPLRLAFQLIQTQTCQPITNAQVELWQTNAQGLYSGQTPAQMCHGREPAQAKAATQATFLRGSQTSDNQGQLTFHSIYPGWYPGRTPHLHLKITIDNETFVITQLYFDEQLSKDIYRSHPDYRDRGPADTLNQRDGIFNRGDSSTLLLRHQTMDDGTLLAYATLGLRSSTDEPLCGDRPRKRQQSRSWNRTAVT